MPRTKCTCCRHPERDEIDRACIAGQSYRRVGERFGLGRMSVARHAASHLPKTLVKAAAAHDAAHADDLLSQVRDLQARTLALLRKAERRGDVRDATSALREARSLIELLARLAGELKTESVTLVVNPQWIEVKTVILASLQEHPQALRAVETALGRLNA